MEEEVFAGFRLAAARAQQVFGLEECFVGATVI